MAAKAMTKSQLISLLADKSGLTKSVAGGLLETLATTAVSETKKNGQFVVPGIGKLVKSHRKARNGRNPQTGETIRIPGQDRCQVSGCEGLQGCRCTAQEVANPTEYRRVEVHRALKRWCASAFRVHKRNVPPFDLPSTGYPTPDPKA